jgi:hypothetical protein
MMIAKTAGIQLRIADADAGRKRQKRAVVRKQDRSHSKAIGTLKRYKKKPGLGGGYLRVSQQFAWLFFSAFAVAELYLIIILSNTIIFMQYAKLNQKLV